MSINKIFSHAYSVFFEYQKITAKIITKKTTFLLHKNWQHVVSKKLIKYSTFYNKFFDHKVIGASNENPEGATKENFYY